MVAGTFSPSTEGWRKADARALLPSCGLQGQQVISFKTHNNNKIVFKMIDWMLTCLHTHLKKMFAVKNQTVNKIEEIVNRCLSVSEYNLS